MFYPNKRKSKEYVYENEIEKIRKRINKDKEYLKGYERSILRYSPFLEKFTKQNGNLFNRSYKDYQLNEENKKERSFAPSMNKYILKNMDYSSIQKNYIDQNEFDLIKVKNKEKNKHYIYENMVFNRQLKFLNDIHKNDEKSKCNIKLYEKDEKERIKNLLEIIEEY